MRLVDLDPRWLVLDGKRVGFVFVSPAQEQRKRSDGATNPTVWRQSCFVEPTPDKVQEQLFEEMFGEHYAVQGCNPTSGWKIDGGIEAANFESMTVMPSLDGSAGGLWHGFITQGEIQ